MKKIVMTMALVMCASSAFADQCAYVTKGQAEKAVSALMDAKTIQTQCEPCGESKAETISPYKSMQIAATNYKNTYEVSVNGKAIDLAYTYVNGLRNLAQLVGCPTVAVSSAIK